MCHGCVYTGSFELDYPRTLLAALHVYRIEIPYRAFPEPVGPRILSLERVNYYPAFLSGRDGYSSGLGFPFVVEPPSGL